MKLRSLSSKIIALLLVIFVIPLSLFSLYVFQQVKGENEREFERRFKVVPQAKQILLERLNQESVFLNDLVKELSGKQWNAGGGSWDYRDFLKKQVDGRSLIALGIFDADFKPVFDASNPLYPIESEPPRDWYLEALSQVTRLTLDTDGKRVWGIVATVLPSSTSFSQKFILREKFMLPDNLLDYLKDITEADFSLVYRSRRILTTYVNQRSKRDLEGEIKSSLTPPSGKWVEPLGNRDYLHLYEFFPASINGEMALVVSIPRALLSQTGDILKKYNLSLFLIGLVISILFGLILSRQIGQPIRQLSEIAVGISRGNYNQHIPDFSEDEIGQLGRSFNVMTTKLNRKMYEIETLFDVSRSMNFMNNSDQLLYLILDKALYAMNAQRGSIMLYDVVRDALEVKMVRSRDHSEVETRPTVTLIRPGEGIAGKVFSSGEIITSNGTGDDRFKWDGDKEGEGETGSNLKSLVCAPLMAKDRAIGVINISNKLSGAIFDDDDCNLLEALASQAAMTIENARLYELSITDGLTKLFINRYFQIRFDEELNRARRYQTPLSLILFDVDHFKKVNDTYGHQAGDLVLIHFAEMIRQSIRLTIDIPCRYGGEEFVVICPETSSEEAKILAERIRKKIMEFPFPGPKENIKVTTSLGIASFPEHGTSKELLVEGADKALYCCKRSGRNQTQIYNSSMEAKQ